MARNRKLQNRIGTQHITDEAEAEIASQASVSREEVEDYIGGMLEGTETFIDVTYDDAGGNLDFVVPVKDEDTMTSNSATHLSTQQSIKTYVDGEIAGVVDSSPATLNTLNELAAALGDDANYASTTATLLGNRLRVDTASQGLSSTQQSNALLNVGITASKAELNILGGGLSAGDIPNLDTSKITSGTFSTVRIADNSITAAKLNVTGDGTTSQFLRSDADGSFSWAIPTNTNTQLSQEEVEDYVGGLLTNGSNITLNYNDTAGTLTISSQDTTYTVGDGGLTQKNFTTTLKNKLDGIASSATATADLTVSGAGTVHPSNYTDTTYSVGDGGLTQNNFTNADHSKLDGIEASATADQTNAEIRTAVEAASDSNVFTDADHTKLNAIEAGATTDQTATEVTGLLADVASYNLGQTTGIVTVNNDLAVVGDLTVSGTTTTAHVETTTVNHGVVFEGTTIDGHDMTLVSAVAGSDKTVTIPNATFTIPTQDTTYSVGDGGLTSRNFTATLKSKLDGIETSADVTDTTNVTAAGALMDSEVTNLSFVKGLASGISSGKVLVANANLTDNDFLKVDGTSIEGRTASEVISDLGLGAAALKGVATDGSGGVADGQGSLVTGNAVYDFIAAQNFSTSGASNFVIGDITGQSALTSGLISTDELVVNDGGALKRMDISVLEGYLQTNLSFPDTNTTYSAGSSTDGITLDGTTFKLKDPDYGTHVTEAGVSLTQDSILFWDGSYDGWKYIKMENLQDLINTDTNTQLTLLDQDDMSSNSATAAASQQSIKAYVDTEVAGLVASAPAALDTLNELAAALGDDANYAATTTTAIGLKLAKASNLSDLANAGIARNNLGLDTAATKGVAANDASGVANGQGSLVTGNAVYQYVAANGGDTNAGAASGSASAPAFSFASDTNTGMYQKAADKIGFSVGATDALEISSAGINVVNNYKLGISDGGVTQPTLRFKDDTDTGLYRPASNQIGFVTGGSQRLLVNADGTIKFNDAFTFPASDGTANQILKTNGSGALSWTVNQATYVTGTHNPNHNSNNSIMFAGSGSSGGQLGVETDYAFNYNPLNNKLTVGTVVSDLTGNADTATSAATLTTGRTVGMTGDVVWTSPSFDGSGNITAASTIQAGAVDIPMLSASGTASSSTYLRGDNTWATVAAGGATTIGALTDVTMDATNFVDSILIQTNSDTSAPTTGTLSNATDNIGIGKDVFKDLTSATNNVVIGNLAGENITTSGHNVIVGKQAGSYLTATQFNSLIGYRAGAFTTGAYNTALGSEALRGSILTAHTGDWNVAIGHNTLQNVEGDSDGNIAIGRSALNTLTTSDYNIAIGYEALRETSTVEGVVAIGKYAAKNLTTAGESVFIGFESGETITTGGGHTIVGYKAGTSYNGGWALTAIGRYAGMYIQGANNTIIGDNAGMSVSGTSTNSSDNVAIGTGVLTIINGGGSNTCVGSYSGYRVTDGHSNTFLGRSAGWNIGTGDGNTGVGNQAGYASSVSMGQGTASYSTAVGYYALLKSNANNNVAVGAWAMENTTTGTPNVAIGRGALRQNTTGGWNIALGYQAGNNITTGSGNVVIGNADVPSATGNDQLSISSGDGSPVWITGTSDGTVNFPASKLQLNGSYGSDGQVLTSTGSGAAWEDAGGGGASEINDLSDAFHAGSNLSIGNTGSGAYSGANHNVAVGQGTLDSITTGDENVAVGNGAGSSVTTGVAGTYIGNNAGTSITTGGYVVAIGAGAMRASTGALNTVVIGINAAYNMTSRYNTTIIGASAGYSVAAGDTTLIGSEAGHSTSTQGAVAVGGQSLYRSTGARNHGFGYRAGQNVTSGQDNTYVGYEAGQGVYNAFQTGHRNTALGSRSLKTLTSGSDNIAVGYYANQIVTSGSRNIAIGVYALDNADTESDNIAIGHQALSGAIDGGDKNVAVGNYTLDAVTSGSNNVAIGHYAGSGLTSGEGVVAIGYEAGKSMTTAQKSIFIGYRAGKSSTTAQENVAIGDKALEDNTTGSSNVAIGHQALSSTTTGYVNVAVGQDVLMVNTTGQRNTGVGGNALRAATTGHYNIALGHYGGDNITTGSGNVIIGRANPTSATADDQLSISSGQSTTPVWITGDSSGVVDFPNGFTSAGAAVGGYAAPDTKATGVNWYGSQLNDVRLNCLPPYGTKMSAIFSFSTSADYDKTIFYPFVAPKTGNLNRMNAYVQTGASGLNMLVGVYSDYNGYPATLLFKGTMDLSTGGNKSITSFTDSGGSSTTPSLVKGTQYHIGFVRDTATTAYQIYCSDGRYAASSGLNLNMSDGYVGAGDVIGQYGGSSNTLAASYNSGSPTWDDFTVFNASVKPASFGVRYA